MKFPLATPLWIRLFWIATVSFPVVLFLVLGVAFVLRGSPWALFGFAGAAFFAWAVSDPVRGFLGSDRSHVGVTEDHLEIRVPFVPWVPNLDIAFDQIAGVGPGRGLLQCTPWSPMGRA